MGKANVSREEIREQLHHDEVMEAGKRLVEWMRQNAKPLGLLAAVILAILFIWKFIEYRTIKAEDEAAIGFSKAELSFNQAIYDDSKKPEERAKLLQEAAKSSEEIRVQFPSASASRLASYLEGLAYLAMEPKEGATDSLDKAISSFRSYADNAKTPTDKARGYLGLAAAYTNRAWVKNNDAGEYKSAAEMYEKAANAAGSQSALASEAKLGLARLYSAQGQNDKAQEIYNEIAKDRKLPDAPKASAKAPKAAGDQQREFMKQMIRSTYEKNSYSDMAKKEMSSFAPSTTKEILDQLEQKPAPAASNSGDAAKEEVEKPAKKTGNKK